MKHALAWILAVGLGLFAPGSARGEEHHATYLGNPATRFAPPLKSPEDLRARLADPTLRPDIESVLRQWRWVGNVDDLYRAAATAEIRDHPIAVGTVLPFMSTRKNGHPICLYNVHWNGREAAPAYAFEFTSRGRRYRCLTPKACSNFLVEDLGAEPRPILSLDCQVPPQQVLGRPLEVCLALHNTGDAPATNLLATLELPPNARLTRATEGGIGSQGRVVWAVDQIATGATHRVCATLAVTEAGPVPFQARLAGSSLPALQSACASSVAGVPAILLEVVDLADPVEIGKEVTYEIRVTNQGTAPGTNIRIACMLPASEEFVSADGATTVARDGQQLTMELLGMLAPKDTATWKVIVRALKEDDARFKVVLTSDQFAKPIHEEEPTQLY